MRFNALEDIDREAWLTRAICDALAIQRSDPGRPIGNILDRCLYGTAAEQWLIEHSGFTNNDEKYQDLLDEFHNRVEIKTTGCVNYVPFVLERLEENAKEPWRNVPETVMVFIGDDKTFEYELHATYDFNQKRKLIKR